MSSSNHFDGLSVLARYTSVVAIAIASSSVPLKGTANDQVRDDQARIESSEDGGSKMPDHVNL